MLIHEITPQEAHEQLRLGKALLVDVREPDEFRAEHIVYAMSVPGTQFAEVIQQLDVQPEQTILFHCRTGPRAHMACVRAQEAAALVNPMANITGGIEGWKQAGLPVVRVESGQPRVSIFRQVQMIVGGLVAFFTVLGFIWHSAFFALAGLFGAALMVAGITGWCGLALFLAKMPWNK